MMENRSFDHMFGFLASPAYPIDGLSGHEANPDSIGELVYVSDDAPVYGGLTPDPPHQFPDVNMQLFGAFGTEADIQCGACPAAVNMQVFGNFDGKQTGPLMQGFVKAYELHTHDRLASHRIMKCMDASKIPALTTLAHHYAVCDRWFSSVPGPTLPNRAFLHGATSIGRIDMNGNWRLMITTIYELLDKFGVGAKIYYHDWTEALTFKALTSKQSKWFGLYDDFERACRKGTLPPYCLIEPRYNDEDQGDNVFQATDQHPDHNITIGDTFIRDVYNAIRSNDELWQSTMLVIIYDEHGGTYDHVVPPATVNPDGRIAYDPGEHVAPIPPFDFTRLGIRVPAVIVSPYIEPVTIDHTVYDHTSVIATARTLFLGDEAAGNPLTKRDAQANTFEHLLTREFARTDMPEFPEPDTAFMDDDFAHAAIPTNSLDKPLSVLQRAFVDQAFLIEQELPPERRSGLANTYDILTERQASVYLRQVAAERPGMAVQKPNQL